MTYNVKIYCGVKIGEKKFKSKNKKELKKRLKSIYAVGCTFKINKEEKL